MKLAGNVGHQNAILAGMLEAAPDVDCVITIDADLQDDISAVDAMLDAFAGGSEIVYGVRADRASDSLFKRATASIYYKLMSKLGIKTIPQHGGFRLVGAAALAALSRYPERNVFLRGIFPSMGFRHESVFYSRLGRKAGRTKYPLSKMLSFAWQGITSFSSQPLRWVSVMGLVVMALSLLYGLYTIRMHFLGVTVPGWSTLAAGMFFLGAVQLLSIAVVGEYIAKIYVEVKGRPRYIREATSWQQERGKPQDDAAE
jgi:glycosyltransferase involved in cell wall biosynthesis